MASPKYNPPPQCAHWGTSFAYGALCGWLAEHTGYRMCGPAMDRYFGDPDNTPPDQLETGVLFPVERV